MISKLGVRSPRLARVITPLRLTRPSGVTVRGVNTIPPSQKETAEPVRTIDPFKFLTKDLERLREDLLNLVPSSQPELTSVARYYFESAGKHLRPALVLLFAQATNGLASGWNEKCSLTVNSDPAAIDRPLSPPDVLTDFNTATSSSTDFPNTD
ncbi:coq1 putative hexaprenyl diphosphate synthase, partial [Ceratobasidium sp. 394]